MALLQGNLHDWYRGVRIRQSQRHQECWSTIMKYHEEDFLRLYDNDADAIFRFVFLRTNDRARSLDIVQEAYLRVWRHLAKGNEVKDLRAFLYQTLRNLIVDSYRSDARRDTDSLDRFFEEGGEIADSKEASPYDQFDIARAQKLLAELEPPEYREAILMRYALEWSPKEIARALNVSENVVSVHINRGIKKLQTQFPA